MSYHGDYAALGTVDFKFSSTSGGSPFALANGTANVYQGNSTTESAAGITLTPNFDGRTGVNHIHIETGANTIFYTPGNDYEVMLIVGQVSGIDVSGRELGSFSIANRSPLRPTTVGRTLDVSVTGEAGLDWANIGGPTTTQNLSATTIKTATDVETETTNIQTRLPTALVNSRMDSTVGAWQSSAGTPLMPTIQGRTLDITTTGEAGFDWANVGAPTTTVNLSGTTIKTATDVETETVNIQSRLPAALTGGRMDSQINAWGSGTPLMPTIQSRTVDITATGEAGIDWNNIGAPTATQNLSGTSTKAVEPTVAGRTLDITTTGEAGVDWSNIGAPTTTQNLSGTTVKAITDAVTAGTVSDKTGYALSAAGLDVVAAPADITDDTAARASFTSMIRSLFNRFFNKVDQTATTQRIYKDDSVTVALSETVSDNNTTQIKGRSS